MSLSAVRNAKASAEQPPPAQPSRRDTRWWRWPWRGGAVAVAVAMAAAGALSSSGPCNPQVHRVTTGINDRSPLQSDNAAITGSPSPDRTGPGYRLALTSKSCSELRGSESRLLPASPCCTMIRAAGYRNVQHDPARSTACRLETRQPIQALPPPASRGRHSATPGSALTAVDTCFGHIAITKAYEYIPRRVLACLFAGDGHAHPDKV